MKLPLHEYVLNDRVLFEIEKHIPKRYFCLLDDDFIMKVTIIVDLDINMLLEPFI